jgi:hypothetical protein
MGLRIIVAGADFSAFGKSYYPLALQEYFSAVPGLTAGQKQAVENVYDELLTQNLSSKIDAFYPLLGDIEGIRVNLMNVALFEMIYNGDSITIDDHGIKNQNGKKWDTQKNVTGKEYAKAPYDSADMCYFFYKTTLSDSSNVFLDSTYLSRYPNQIAVKQGYHNYTNVRGVDLAYSPSLNVHNIVTEQSQRIERLSSNGITALQTTLDGAGSANTYHANYNVSAVQFGLQSPIGNNSTAFGDRYGCFGVGRGLSENETKILNNIVQRFMCNLGRISESERDERVISI